MARKALSAVGIVNVVTRATNEAFTTNLPYTTKSTFSDFGKQLATAPEEYKNKFYDNLINLCGMQIILGKRAYESYFKKLYKEPTLTENIALYMVDAIKAKSYDPEATSRILENDPPRIGVQYIQSILKRQYQVSDVEDLLTSAFTSEGAFMSAFDAITTQLYSSMEDDNVIIIKDLLNQNIAEGNIRLVPISKPTNQAGLLSFMTNVKKIGSDWAVERSREWDVAGYRTYSPADDHYFLINTELDALNEVYNLPFAFNKSYLEMRSEGEAIVMGSSALAGGNVYAMMFDRDFLQIRDRVNHPRFTSFFNPSTLAMNRFLTVFSIMSVSLFSNACAFIDPSAVGFDATTPATLATRDGNSKYNPGSVAELYVSAIKADTGKYADKFGKWSITGSTDTETYIDEDSGELYLGPTEAGTVAEDTKYYITVTWTSHLDSTVTATKLIEINH